MSGRGWQDESWVSARPKEQHLPWGKRGVGFVCQQRVMGSSALAAAT